MTTTTYDARAGVPPTEISSGDAPHGAYLLDSHIADDEDLPLPVRAIRVGADGDVTVKMAANPAQPVLDGNEITYTAVAGELLRGPIVRVLSTGTTATDLVGYV